MQKFIVASSIGAALAGSIELVSSDVRSGGIGIDNIKGKWSQKVSLFGNDATISGEYDRSKNKDSLHETTVSGSLKNVKYELTDAKELKLEADANGLTLETSGNLDDGLRTIGASGSTKLGGQDIDAELEHALGSGDSKLKLSTVLGNGFKAIANVARAKSGDASADYELEYEGTINEGRTVSATLKPDGSGEMEYEDTTTLKGQDTTISASMEIGGAPKVSVKRSWNF